MNRRQFVQMVAALSATTLLPREVNKWVEQQTLENLCSVDLVLAFKDSEGEILAMGLIEASNPASQGMMKIDNADFYAIRAGMITTAEIVNGDYVVTEIPVTRGHTPSQFNHGIYMDQIHVNTGDCISLLDFTIRG